ncbi:tyrosine-type recombinase/integrase [Methanococcoides sp. SA1]|nr:tyrosine-type recombinase/integrase [Methanococcoides sp. SA1]
MSIYKIDVEKRLEYLKAANISEKNKELINKFIDKCFSEGLGEHRVLKYISTLKNIALDLNLDLDNVKKEDIEKYISRLERSGKSEWSKHDYKVTLKKYYKMMNGGEDPETTKWIKTTMKKTKQKLPEDMLTETEVLEMINIASSTRDKALIALLWDIGARIGEIGELLIKHVKFDEYGAVILLSGKTGSRRVRAVWSVSYLMNLLEEHPDNQNPNAPLWINRLNGNNYKPIEYKAILIQIKRIASKAGLKKIITPHLFRHSRATYMANHLTEAQMNAYFGWIQGSEMPSIYVHLSGKDVDKSVLRANGIEIEEDEEKNKTKPQKCPRCKTLNTSNNMFCFRCGAALTIEVALELEEKAKPVEEKITQLLENQINELVEARINEILKGINSGQ